ncbi:MAG: trypsin-like serine protease [Kofleriaceae bacterium]
MLRTRLVWIVAITSLVSCVTEELAVDPESATSQEIHGADSLASQSHANRAVALIRQTSDGWRRFCTGTFIDDNHVLTAAHCKATVNDRVSFYTVPDQMDTGRVRQIVNITRPAGTNPFTGDLEDNNGAWADLAVLQLSSTAGAPAVIAALRWTYPGAGVNGVKVGAGAHSTPAVAQLRQVTDPTDSPNDHDGSFMTEDDDTDSFDSGGPFYFNGLWVTGVLTGSDWDADSVTYRNLYTSVPHHLDFILGAIGYAWSGGATEGRYRGGVYISLMSRSERVCKYACDRTTTCVAFNHHSLLNQCELLSAVTSSTSSSSWRSDLKP